MKVRGYKNAGKKFQKSVTKNKCFYYGIILFMNVILNIHIGGFHFSDFFLKTLPLLIQ